LCAGYIAGPRRRATWISRTSFRCRRVPGPIRQNRLVAPPGRETCGPHRQRL